MPAVSGCPRAAYARRPMAIRGAPDRTVQVAFVALIALGGSNAVAIKVGNVELPPFWGATLRFGLAAVIVVALALLLRAPMPRGRQLLGAALYGLVAFAGSYAFAYFGLTGAPAGVAQVVLALAPLLTLVFAVAHRLEPFRWHGLAGSMIAAVGILVVFGDQLSGDVPLVALLAMLAAAACMAESSVLAKLIPPGPPVGANAVGMSVGAVVLVAISLLAGERWSLPVATTTWLSVLYLASVGSVGLFLAFLFVLQRWTATATSYVLLLMPLWTVIAAAVVLGEQVRPAFGLGAVLVLAGTYVGAFLKPRPRRAPVCQPPEALPAGVAQAADAAS